MNSLTELIIISNQTIAIAKRAIPLIDKIPINDYPLFVGSIHNLILLSNRLTFSEDITLIELAQNNYEFLDTLKTILTNIDDKISMQTADREELVDLTSKIDITINQIDSPPFLQHRKRTPSDATVPRLER